MTELVRNMAAAYEYDEYVEKSMHSTEKDARLVAESPFRQFGLPEVVIQQLEKLETGEYNRVLRGYQSGLVDPYAGDDGFKLYLADNLGIRLIASQNPIVLSLHRQMVSKQLEALEPAEYDRLSRAYESRLGFLRSPPTGTRDMVAKVSALYFMIFYDGNPRTMYMRENLPFLNGHLCVVKAGTTDIVNTCYTHETLQRRVKEMTKAAEDHFKLKPLQPHLEKLTAIKHKFVFDVNHISVRFAPLEDQASETLTAWLEIHMVRIIKILRTVFGRDYVETLSKEEFAQVAAMMQAIAPADNLSCVPTALLYSMSHPNTDVAFSEVWFYDNEELDPPRREHPFRYDEPMEWLVIGGHELMRTMTDRLPTRM